VAHTRGAAALLARRSFCAKLVSPANIPEKKLHLLTMEGKLLAALNRIKTKNEALESRDRRGAARRGAVRCGGFSLLEAEI